MTYEFQNKKVNIPDTEIENAMKVLDLTKEEAIQMWLEDNDYLKNEEVEELTTKAKANRRYEKSDAPRKKVSKERKVDEDKAYLLQILIDAIKNEVPIASIKNEAEFAFTYAERNYTVKLIKHNLKK